MTKEPKPHDGLKQILDDWLERNAAMPEADKFEIRIVRAQLDLLMFRELALEKAAGMSADDAVKAALEKA